MKTKVLVFIDWYLPGYKAGGPVRSCANLVAHLNDALDFYIVTRNTDYCEDQPYEGVESNAWNQVHGAHIYYLSNDKVNKAGLQELIANTPFDVAYINGIYSPLFSILPLRLLKKTGKPIVVAARGMFAPSAINVKKTKKKLFLAVAQLTGLYKNITFHATNIDEAVDIRKAIGRAQVKVAPNLPRKYDDIQRFQPNKEAGALRLVSMARIAPEKNTLYALEVLKHCKGNIQFDLYGSIYSETYWNECKAVIEQLPQNIVVQYKGSIDSSLVEETLQQYHFLWMPTRGENFGHIILESFVASIPVIISDQTPWTNLEKNKLGFDLPLNNKQPFAAAIDHCCAMDQTTYETWSNAAFMFGAAVALAEEAVTLNKQLFLNG